MKASINPNLAQNIKITHTSKHKTAVHKLKLLSFLVTHTESAINTTTSLIYNLIQHKYSAFCLDTLVKLIQNRKSGLFCFQFPRPTFRNCHIAITEWKPFPLQLASVKDNHNKSLPSIWIRILLSYTNLVLTFLNDQDVLNEWVMGWTMLQHRKGYVTSWVQNGQTKLKGYPKVEN